MKNILYLSETSEPGGAESVLADIVKNIDPNKYSSLVCLLTKGWLTEHLDKIGVEYTIIENKWPYDPFFLLKLIRLIKRRKIDLIHSHEFMMSVYGSVAAFLTSIPMIGTVHGKLYYTDRKRRILFFKLAVKLSSRMIMVSKELERFFTSNLKLRNTEKIMTVYNGIDLNKFKPSDITNDIRKSLSVPEDSIIAGSFGSLFEVKGLDYLLDAVKLVKADFPNFHLLLAGTGDQETALKEQTKKLGLEQDVSFLGFREDIPDLLNVCDLYICSSISEGLSLSILEAMAMNKPIVATDVGGNPELIIDGSNGFLVPPRSPDKLAEKMKFLIRDRERRLALGYESRRIVEEKFSLETMLTEYQNLYSMLL